MCIRDRDSCEGFTLIELSIVLVIIGLIVGGVLVGQDLIQASKERALVTEKEQFEQGVFAFKLKYNALPGDLPTAKMNQLGLTGFNNCTSGGNNNKSIGGIYAPAGGDACESSNALNHLAEVGYIAESQLAIGAYGNQRYMLETKVFKQVAWQPFSWSKIGDFSNWLVLQGGTWQGAQPSFAVSGGAGQDQHLSGLAPSVARRIDTKIDDGKPLTGSMTIIGYEQGSGPCDAILTGFRGSCLRYANDTYCADGNLATSDYQNSEERGLANGSANRGCKSAFKMSY